MLKKNYRLSQIRLVRSSHLSTSFFNVKFAENNLGFSRIGFVISKKVDKRATERNKLKRKFSSCIEEIFDRIEVGKDFVFYPSIGSINVPREILLEEIKKTLKIEK